jgi:hypothetical protein
MSGIIGIMTGLCLTLQETAKLSSSEAVPSGIPTDSEEQSSCSCPRQVSAWNR